LEAEHFEQNKQLATLKNMVMQKDEKVVILAQKYTKVQAKYELVKERIKA
jgi:hypothetical protein